MSSPADVAARIADSLNVAVTEDLEDDVMTARGLVAAYIKGYEHRFVDAEAARVLARAIEKCAIELFEQRKAPSGVRAFGDLDGAQVVRVARDPMVAARPLLAPFIGLAIS